MDGKVVWAFPTRNTSNATPSIGADGTIYTGDFDDFIYAVSPTGSLIWERRAPDHLWTSPLLRDDNTVVFSSDDYSGAWLMAKDGSTGNEIWTTNAGRGDMNNPILGRNGNIFVNCGGGTINHGIKAFSADGQMLWSTPAVDPMDLDHGAVGPDGTVYYGSLGGRMAAFDPNTGQTLWLTDVGDAHIRSPAIAADGTVYAGGSDGFLRAYDPGTGRILWTFDTGSSCTTGVSIDGGGVMYVGARDVLFAVDADGREVWRLRMPASMGDSTPIIGGEGRLYVAGRGGHLYAVVPEPATFVLLAAAALAVICRRRHAFS